MSVRKCCVGDCPSTNRTHRLFFLPKDDHLRELWLSFIIPTNVELSGLTKLQLCQKGVCQEHFDRFQFDAVGNRLPKGYPCLFSAKEMLYGIPLTSTGSHHLSDHNYNSLLARDVDVTSGMPEGRADHVPDGVPETHEDVMVRPAADTSDGVGDHLKDHIYFSSHEIDTELSTTEISAGDSELLSEETNKKIMHAPLSSEPADLPRSLQQKCTKRPFLKQVHMKKLAQESSDVMKCAVFVKKLKRHALVAKNRSYVERLNTAESVTKDRQLLPFLANFHKLNRQAQNFIMMQLTSVDKQKRGVRFTDEQKLLALSFLKESPKGYRILQKVFKLPSKRTLNRLAQDITFGVGLNDNLFKLIKNKCMKWDTSKKICSIVFDEVALTPHLTYVESKDEIKGFKDLGDQKHSQYCDHALVFMLRGACYNWKQPIAYYFCEGTTSAAELKRILKELVAKVAETGLIPIALVCDQGSTFRSALKTFRGETEFKRNQKGEHNDGTIEVAGQNLSVVFDPPHLLKGLRNNFLTKNIIFNGAVATWNDIKTVYEADCQLGHTRMNKNLTENHIEATKIKKMKVSVAAQTLSGKTSAMLKYTALFGITASGNKVSNTMRTTGEAVEFIDKLFDSVNGSRRGTVRGKLRGAVKPTSNHFQFWKDAIKTLKGMKFVDSSSKRAQRNKKEYYVRVPSLDGWITTLESFERIAKLLFNKYGLTYFYPRRINQDPIENFFGRIRAINYRNVNPDTYTFVNSFKTLLISNSMGPHSIYSNCEEDDGLTFVDFYSLLQVHVGTHDKENVPVNLNSMQSSFSLSPNVEHGRIKTADAVVERLRVHSSAYTAGYICRKISKKYNCKRCQDTYLANSKENIHEWILYREYKILKNSNLSYPSKRILLIYKDISSMIHKKLNVYAFKKNVSTYLKQDILDAFDINWLGCTLHGQCVRKYFLQLILRIHIHNWCNVINKILKGHIAERHVLKMGSPQIKAYDKYKTLRLKSKNK